MMRIRTDDHPGDDTTARQPEQHENGADTGGYVRISTVKSKQTERSKMDPNGVRQQHNRNGRRKSEDEDNGA